MFKCNRVIKLYAYQGAVYEQDYAEGLNRLLKLIILDHSFNKFITTKGLCQLVENYKSLLTLNLLGSPIQSNISEDQLCKAICGILSKLTYLNKHPAKMER